MKFLSKSLLEYYASGQTELAYGILIEQYGPGDPNFQLIPDVERPQYQLFGFTSHDKPARININGWSFFYATGDPVDTWFIFDSVQGFDLSTIVSSDSLNVNNLEITTLDDGSFFNREDIIAGKWANTFFRIFRYRTDIENIQCLEDCETLFKGWFGEFKLNDTSITIELRGMADLLQNPIGEVSTKTCRNEFADSRCGLGTDGNFLYNITITEVISQREFIIDPPPGTIDTFGDYFNSSLLTFTSGQNTNLSNRVLKNEFNTIVLNTPMILPIEVGDTIRMFAGCNKTLFTCINKFNNVQHFRGEPHRPTTDSLSSN